jgi:sialate O-acetylesterase
MKKIKSLLLINLFPLLMNAQLSVPEIFSSNMVLQQKANVLIWGTAKVGDNIAVSVSWVQQLYKARTGNDGRWKVTIATPAAGGPHTIKITSGNLVKQLDNVLTGEVWLCSGQSNMTMPMEGFLNQPVLQANELLMDADDPQLRMFTVGRATSLAALSECKGKWQVSNAAIAKDFSAVAYLYGSILRRKLKVPVGLIMSGWGGTKVQSWMPEECLRSFPKIIIPTFLDTVKEPHKKPVTLYNGMIAPLTGYGIKGVIWFQGESNRSEAEQYAPLFTAMVKAWREKWAIGEFPFYYVQIAPYAGKTGGTKGEYLREAQLNCLKTIPNTGMAVLLDVGMQYDIHFADKLTVAKRLSYYALNRQYGYSGLEVSGPVLSRSETEGSKMILSFDHASNGITSYGKPLTLFEVAGDDKVFYPAKATITTRGLEVESNKVSKPVAVRYAFRDWVVGELYNNEGLPASSFRTDNW